MCDTSPLSLSHFLPESCSSSSKIGLLFFPFLSALLSFFFVLENKNTEVKSQKRHTHARFEHTHRRILRTCRENRETESQRWGREPGVQGIRTLDHALVSLFSSRSPRMKRYTHAHTHDSSLFRAVQVFSLSPSLLFIASSLVSSTASDWKRAEKRVTHARERERRDDENERRVNERSRGLRSPVEKPLFSSSHLSLSPLPLSSFCADLCKNFSPSSQQLAFQPSISCVLVSTVQEPNPISSKDHHHHCACV